MSYTSEDVRAGRELVLQLGRSQWALGDLALKIAPPGADNGYHNGSQAILADFAEQIGLAYESLRDYRYVASRWPRAARAARASYTLHRELKGHNDRETLLREYLDSTDKPSYRGLQAFLGRRPTTQFAEADRGEQVRQGLAEMPSNERAEIVREALADEDTADEVMLADGPHRENAITAVSRAHGREDLQRPRPAPHDERERTRLDDQDETVRVMIALRKVSRDLEAAAGVLQGVTVHHERGDVREGFAALVTGIENRLDIVRGLVQGRSMDDELAELGGAA